RYTDNIVALTRIAVVGIFSSTIAIISRIGPASPTLFESSARLRQRSCDINALLRSTSTWFFCPNFSICSFHHERFSIR
ncbi:hypothetical protein GIB67_036732, partial [Kingdonia uniflora]